MGGTDGQRKKLAFLVGFANGSMTTLSATRVRSRYETHARTDHS